MDRNPPIPNEYLKPPKAPASRPPLMKSEAIDRYSTDEPPIPYRRNTGPSHLSTPIPPPRQNSFNKNAPARPIKNPPTRPISDESNLETDSGSEMPVPEPRPSTSRSVPIPAPRSTKEANIVQYENPVKRPRPHGSTDFVRPPSPAESYADIADMDYYYGKLSENDIKLKFQNALNGSFLVRDSTRTPGEFTLVLKNQNKINSIKICHNTANGTYGFTNNCEFDSVVDLIKFYQRETLQTYNLILDTKLLYPITKTRMVDEYCGDGVEKDVETLIKLMKGQNKLIDQLENCKAEKNELQEKLISHKQMQEAFEKTEEWFKEQIEICKKNRNSVPPYQSNAFIDNLNLLKEHKSQVENGMERLKADIYSLKREFKDLESKSNDLQRKLDDIQSKEDETTSILIRQGVSEELIKRIKSKGKVAWEKKDQYKPHQDRSNWYFPDYNREKAIANLLNCKDGTFLIRKTNHGEHGLSIKHNNAIFHCVIYETKSGFGFEEPYNIYMELTDLVLHYARNSLGEHNNKLDTCLKYPYNYYITHSREINEQSEEDGEWWNF